MGKIAYKILSSKQFTLYDFVDNYSVKNCIRRIKINNNDDPKRNELYDFVEKTYNYALNSL